MLRLNVGTNRKIGQPDYGSAGASCSLEIEIDSDLFRDREGLQKVVRQAYSACITAVNDELARLTHHDNSQTQPQEIVEVRTSPAISGAPVARIPAAQFSTQPSPRPATASQVRALRAICARRKIDLVGLLRERFGLTTTDQLCLRDASSLIDELKADSETSTGTNGNRAYAAGGPSPGVDRRVVEASGVPGVRHQLADAGEDARPRRTARVSPEGAT
jgi:hypothetical protein